MLPERFQSGAGREGPREGRRDSKDPGRGGEAAGQAVRGTGHTHNCHQARRNRLRQEPEISTSRRVALGAAQLSPSHDRIRRFQSKGLASRPESVHRGCGWARMAWQGSAHLSQENSTSKLKRHEEERHGPAHPENAGKKLGSDGL